MAKNTSAAGDAINSKLAVHFLDVGAGNYGDAVLCEFGKDTVLIDGAHRENWQERDEEPSIPGQIASILRVSDDGPLKLSLVIVSHLHNDHIGCLPQLVDKNLIDVEWALLPDPTLRWANEDTDAITPARALAEALQEEFHADASDSEIEALIDSAGNLRDRYRRMIETLRERGTQVVLYGARNVRLARLLERFRAFNFEILGPSRELVRYCSKLIDKRTGDMMNFSDALLAGSEGRDGASLLSAYREIFRAIKLDSLAEDALKKDKGAINDASLVTVFEFQGQKLLFTGDMQLEDPEVSDDRIDAEIASLRETIKARGPYVLTKLSHHGSYNGFSETLWEEFGRPPLVGICTGSESAHHPNRTALQVLTDHEDEIKWARTDKNGCVTFSWSNGKPKVALSRGKINDPTPPPDDEATTSASPSLPATPTLAVSSPSLPSNPELAPLEPVVVPSVVEGADRIEVHAIIPHRSTRVTITIDVEPRDGARQGAVGAPDRRGLRLADGRDLPRLLFLTSRDALGRNIGRGEADAALSAIRGTKHVLVDEIPDGVSSFSQIVPTLRAKLGANRDVAGVVVLGGYDVVPPQLLDALPSKLRDGIGDHDDPDDFTVLSDDVYGDRDGDGLPELPVSRIPDGLSSKLFLAALQAPNHAAPQPRHGVRNFARPFADGVFADLPGSTPILTSRTTLHTHSYSLDAERVYLMLHGSDADGTRFWGEDNGRHPIAVGIGNVPKRPGMVVLTGCCWGAFVGARRDGAVSPATLGTKTAETSIALRFLAHGARAYVGCTGAHYSPTISPFAYFGGPLHRTFWKAYNDGASPAQALFVAKAVYMRDMPHGRPKGSLGEAIEFKILRQFTCLGLGW